MPALLAEGGLAARGSCCAWRGGGGGGGCGVGDAGASGLCGAVDLVGDDYDITAVLIGHYRVTLLHKGCITLVNTVGDTAYLRHYSRTH